MSSIKPRSKNLKGTKEKRRELRNNSTLAEKYLWKMVKGRQVKGLRFRRQFSIGNYILDFYCPQIKLCIELDGDYHCHVLQPVLDAERDEFLLHNYGITTMRFENRVVFDHPYVIPNAIINFYNETNSHDDITHSPPTPSNLEGELPLNFNNHMMF